MIVYSPLFGGRIFSLILFTGIVCILVSQEATFALCDPTYSLLYSFGSSAANDGLQPGGSLIQASDGSFYGTTCAGGTGNKGTVFRFTLPSTMMTLHSFGDGTVRGDGATPRGALVEGFNGNFYGTTEEGGATGNGTVYEMSPSGQITLLHSFFDGSVASDGKLPLSGLVQGADGNFYGMTLNGGTFGAGSIYQITPSGTETVLHSFGDPSVENDGRSPSSWLVQGLNGNFFGTTDSGGSSGNGTFFEITPTGSLTVRFSFGANGPNGGAYPRAGVIEGSDGNFYGTTYLGGIGHSGTIYELSPSGIETALHSFQDGTVNQDGYFISSGLLQASDNAIYGTSYYGGRSGAGVVFRLDSTETETLLHSFADSTVSNDGSNANSGLIQGSDGTIYGVTQYGGSANGGTIFNVDDRSDTRPNFTVSAPNQLLQLSQTQSVVSSFTITPSAGFTGAVHILCSVEPPLTDVQFSPSSVSLANGPSTVTAVWKAASTSPSGRWSAKVTVTDGSTSKIISLPIDIPSPAPEIASVKPTHCAIGSKLVITGKNLAGASLIEFAGNVSAIPIHASATETTVVVPLGATTGPVSLESVAGQAVGNETISISGSEN